MNHLPVFLIGLAGGVFLDEFDFGNELPGTPQKAVDWAEPLFPPIKILVTSKFFVQKSTFFQVFLIRRDKFWHRPISGNFIHATYRKWIRFPEIGLPHDRKIEIAKNSQ